MNLTEQVRLAAESGPALRAAVANADIAPLLMSLVQLTGNVERLEQAKPYITGGWNYLQSIPQDMQDLIRAELVDAIQQAAAKDEGINANLPDSLLHRMMETAVGQPVPEIYKPVFYEETNFGGIDRRDVEWRQPPDRKRLSKFQVIIIGAGFSGIAMAIKLQNLGIPYVIIEKNTEVGGTWYENKYPGVGVDTPCHFYSYSFAPNTEWSQFFAKGDEIQNYILRCVSQYDIRGHIRFSEEVTEAKYEDASSRWIVSVRRANGENETLQANVLVSAVGALNRPAIPTIPGLATFSGASFHTAQWDTNVKLDGKRVAMIGTGASGMQAGPTIAQEVEHLTIFQRSPHWAIRHPLYHAEVSPAIRWAMKHIPFYASWFRFQLFWAASDGFHATLQMDPAWRDAAHSLNAQNAQLRKELIDYIKSELGERTDLLPKVIPDYPPFGKRMLRDNNWYKMLLGPNVDLVTDRIDHIETNAVIANGTRYPTDVIVLATGFQASKMLGPMEVRGRSGASLRDLWGDDNPRAHLGITVPDFPNFFLIYGPNTNLAHGGSAIFHSECQVRYIVLAIRELIEKSWDYLEVNIAPFESYNERVDAAHRKMVWSHPGVTNWYKNKGGRVTMNSPWRLVDYRNLIAEFNLTEYSFGQHTRTVGKR